MYQEILRMSLMQSLESGHHEIAQKIHGKFGDHKNKISKDPYFESYLERYFVTCRQIDNFKLAKTKREKKQQTIKMCTILHILFYIHILLIKKIIYFTYKKRWLLFLWFPLFRNCWISIFFLYTH